MQNNKPAKVTDEFTTTGDGILVDVSIYPVSKFTLLVDALGAVTSWNIVLESSLDGINFTTILTHTKIIGDKKSIFCGSTISPSMFFRVKCTELTLGPGTKIITTVLGVQ